VGGGKRRRGKKSVEIKKRSEITDLNRWWLIYTIPHVYIYCVKTGTVTVVHPSIG
jgi:hypothetical protein